MIRAGCLSVDTEILDVVEKRFNHQYIANSGRNYPGYERDGVGGFCDSPGKKKPRSQASGSKTLFIIIFALRFAHA